MEKLVDLKDLLRHEVQDLISAEDQIIEAMPAMIEKANNGELKKALRDHLRVTGEQRKRLDKVNQLMGDAEEAPAAGEKKGLFGRLFGSGGHKCKGMEGLITEGQKVMGEDMNEEVLDAAIIAVAQKIEHYEICGYGTARAFAKELKLAEVERLLTQTLNEEYSADNLLTKMAVGKLNVKAENAGNGNGTGSRTATGGTAPQGGSKSGRSAAGAAKTASKSSAPVAGGRSSDSNKSSAKNASKESSKTAGKSVLKSSGSKGSSKTSGGSKSASKSASKGSSKSATANKSGSKGSTSTKSKSTTASSRSSGNKSVSGKSSRKR